MSQTLFNRLVKAYTEGKSCEVRENDVPEAMKLIGMALAKLKQQEYSRERDVSIQQMIRLRRKILRDTRTNST